MCADDEREDLGHCLIVEGVHADDVEVAQVAWRHIVTATTRWTHRTEELDVLQRDLGCVLQIVPGMACHVIHLRP